ncbi:MAG: glycosyltransferase family 2 protein [Lachnospiraceae bacterium]|nr:glycosyltransferase family 2 protein [Lachnospiraceae bacterium]
MGEKILSISIAAYNVEPYLERTLQSLVCDGDVMDKFEVLIIDDGSVDGTASIARKYMENYPNTFIMIQKENGGHGSALTASISRAQGRYFKMLDGDDWYETEGLQQLIIELEKMDADIILSYYKRIYERDGRIEEIVRHQLIAGKKYTVDCLNSSLLEVIHAHEMTVRTAVLKKQFFPLTEHCAYTDDEYVFWAILHADTYMKLPIYVYCYRIGTEGQTVTTEGRKKHWRDAGKVVLAMLRRYAACDKKNMFELKKKYLFEAIYHTVEFQYANYFLAENISEVERDFEGFNSRLETMNAEFYEWIKENNRDYKWLKQLFGAAHKIGNRECVIFGMGAYGKAALKIFRGKGVSVTACADNDSRLWNTEINGVTVCEPNTIKLEYPQALVFIAASKHGSAIYRQLIGMDIDITKIINNEEYNE